MAMLTTISLIIFIVELRIPTLAPIPGMKLGLANIITVYAVYTLNAKEAGMILFGRILLGSMFSGNVSALIYSISGAVLCLLGMLILRRMIGKEHLWLCSIFGAVFHNIGQTTAAVFVMKTTAVIAYLPFLLVSGCIAGLFTGLCATYIVRSERYTFLSKETSR